MPERGKIRNREYAQQIRDFSGLRYGKITPTDIDAFLDFGDKLFVIIEGKHGGGTMPYGQRLAIERLCDACDNPADGRRTVAVVVSHETEGDIDYAACPVTMYRWNAAWHEPKKDISLRAFIDRLLKMMDVNP